MKRNNMCRIIKYRKGINNKTFMTHLKSAGLTTFPALHGDLAGGGQLALKLAVVLVLPVDGAPEESLAGEATVAAVVNMPRRREKKAN